VSSKADDFDIRYRDVRNGDSFADGADAGYASEGYASEGYANGGYGAHPGGAYPDGGYANDGYESPAAPGSTVDYDLGYDAQGWDTQ